MHHTKTVWLGIELLVGNNRNGRRWNGAIAMAAACVLGTCATARAANVYPNIPFSSPGTPGNVQAMDVYTPSGGTNDRCTIVLAHGGGYSTGDKNEFAGIGMALADLGYTAISVNYQLVTPATSGAGQGTFPQPSCDVLNAVRWVRNEGQGYGLPSRIVLCGSSAGSTIALHAAMAVGHAPLSVLPPAGPRGYVIDGAIGIFGRYDLNWNAQAYGLPDYVNAYLGLGSVGVAPMGASSASPGPAAVYASASAATYAENCSPPTVLFHGDADGLVPVGNAYRLQQAMNQAGAPVLVHVVPGGGHTNTILGPTDAAQAMSIHGAVQWIFQHTRAACGQDVLPPPPPMGACCADSGACSIRSEALCESGVWIVQAGCVPNPCQAPSMPGACCMGAACAVLLPQQCADPGMSFFGTNTACNPQYDFRTPCCRADFDQDGHLGVVDIFEYLTAWFAGDVRCVPDNQGATPTVAHIFLFLNMWFAGC